MTKSVSVLAAGSLAAFLGGLAPAADEPRLRLEFRRAETEAAKGLEEATVPGSGAKIYLHKTADADAADVAAAILDDSGCEPVLKVVFTREGRAKMEKLSKEHHGKPLAVVLDGKVLVAPVIRATITEKAVLTGIDKADLERILKGFKAK
jgi:preprotein translocase subunit SecD